MDMNYFVIGIKKYAFSIIFGIFIFSAYHTGIAATGYFQLHNLMSAAQKNIPSQRIFNDANLNLENQEQKTGHVVNTTFANDGGMGGCGVTSTLMQYMYQNTGTVDRSKNYIAFNVYSQIMGYDPKAPFWGDLKGYLMGSNGTNVAYPNTPYHRIIPSLYPAYLGLYNNGLNCGRWIEANFDTHVCFDRTTTTGISKFCPDVSPLTYAGPTLQGYVFDSCEDNNGWCRDDAAHPDVNFSALMPPANYYLQWKFIKNPYYSDPKAPASLKDIWLAWFSQPSRYWSYVAILNAENGVSNVIFNIGDTNNPTWINSHVLAGDNNVTWSSGSNNGQLWQIEPVNALTDAVPPINPMYQMRLFDYLGYPANRGAIYQFRLTFDDGSIGQNVGGFNLFYQGGARVKPGTQAQNMTVLLPPVGTGKITVSFNQLLPSNVSLDATKPNYLRPILMTHDGYTWDPDQCTANQCVYSKLPTASTFHVFAHALEEVSNDLTLRKVNDVSIASEPIYFLNGSTTINYVLKASEINLSTLYAARIDIPLKFTTTSLTPINGNLQALFVPDNSKNAASNITAQTQGCFLNTYLNTITAIDQKHATYNGNTTTCTVYYMVNHESDFSSTTPPPAASFTVILPMRVGISPVNYALTAPYAKPVQVTGYNPLGNPTPLIQTMPLATYQQATDLARTLYLLLDPQSDATCLQNLDPLTGVSVSINNTTTLNITKADIPMETQITQPATTISTQVNLAPGTKNLSCQAMLAVLPSGSALNPGLDVVEVIKLATIPKPLPPKQGIEAVATGDTACLSATDTLLFSSNGTLVATAVYTPSTAATNVGISAPPGTYTISDKPFNVVGGSCQLSSPVVVSIQNNAYTPTKLHYKFAKAPGSTCIAMPQVTGSWPNGCTIQFILSSGVPLQNVTLSWLKGLYDWTRAQVWGGEGSLAIPPSPTQNVTWALPSWVNAQGSNVGMTINNDGVPSICSAFSGSTPLAVSCGGIVT